MDFNSGCTNLQSPHQCTNPLMFFTDIYCTPNHASFPSILAPQLTWFSITASFSVLSKFYFSFKAFECPIFTDDIGDQHSPCLPLYPLKFL